MRRRNQLRRISYDDMVDIDKSYDDEHMNGFYDLLFQKLLPNIQGVKLVDIMKTHLRDNDAKHAFKISAFELSWRGTADRKYINNRTIYSFRFPNLCTPDLYETFSVASHPLFVLVRGERHRLEGWYMYVGNTITQMLQDYLGFDEIANESSEHKITIFIHNKCERLDIQFDFQTHSRQRISITFEPGFPSI